MADIVHQITQYFPHLPTLLRMAHMRDRPEAFTKKMLLGAFYYAAGIAILAGFMLYKFMPTKKSADAAAEVVAVAAGQPDPLRALTCAGYGILIFAAAFILFFIVLMNSPRTKINRRCRDLEREVLFAGRYLLVKIHSGRPLLNALIDASQSYGISSKYFKELVDDINMGTPIEKALDNAMKYSPSPKYRKILFQVSNAIKIGIDVSEPLSNCLDEISQEQLIEIQRYGKKLNSLTIFYMLIAVVMPSIGVAMFAVIGSLIGLGGTLAQMIFYAILGLLLIIQLMFIMIFKSARLTVNI
jgi:pilus assembly protein TadC